VTTTIEWRGLTISRDTGYRVTAISGWEDLPDLTSTDEPRAFRDGDITRPRYARGRVVTVEGHLTDPGATGGLVAALQIAAARSDQVEPLSITLFGRRLTAQARIVRRTLPQDLGYQVGRQRWALQWSCPDPLRFGPLVGSPATRLPGAATGVVLPTTLPAALGSAGNAVDVPNDGNAAYRPVLRVTGPTAGGFQISDIATGRRLRYAADVPVGETVTVDLDLRRVTLSGGTSVRRLLDVAQWFDIPSGGTTIRFTQLATGGTPDPRATLTALDIPAGAHL